MTAADAPDLIFLDLDLPDMSGAACCLALKTDTRTHDVPVVMIAPEGRESDIGLCRHAGCDAVISNPIDHKDFVATAQKFIKIEERAMFRFPVRLTIQHGPDLRQLLSGYSVNLCPGGLFLQTDNVVAKDTVVVVELVLPDNDRKISSTARVAWVNDGSHSRKVSLPVGMGLQFLNMRQEDTELIRNFVLEKIKDTGLQIGQFNVPQWA